MFIQTEQTPNPATLKFLPGQTVMENGTADFRSEDDAAVSPLAQRLFKVSGVSGVFFGRDFITVTKEEAKEWMTVKPMVLAGIMEHFSSGKPVMAKPIAEDEGSENDNEIVVQIKELLNTRIRPAVAQDGGDVVFHEFDEGILYLEMRGACAGCPSSTATLKMGIENMMRHYVPEVIEVRPAPQQASDMSVSGGGCCG